MLEWRPHLRRDALWGFDPDAGVPFTRRKHSDLIQELVDPRQQVVPVLCLVGNIVENLPEREREREVVKGRLWVEDCISPVNLHSDTRVCKGPLLRNLS